MFVSGPLSVSILALLTTDKQRPCAFKEYDFLLLIFFGVFFDFILLFVVGIFQAVFPLNYFSDCVFILVSLALFFVLKLSDIQLLPFLSIPVMKVLI